MNLGQKRGSWQTTVSATPSQLQDATSASEKADGVPGKCKNHAAAGCHDAQSGKDETNKRQPRQSAFSNWSKTGTTYMSRQTAPARLFVAW